MPPRTCWIDWSSRFFPRPPLSRSATTVLRLSSWWLILPCAAWVSNQERERERELSEQNPSVSWHLWPTRRILATPSIARVATIAFVLLPELNHLIVWHLLLAIHAPKQQKTRNKVDHNANWLSLWHNQKLKFTRHSHEQVSGVRNVNRSDQLVVQKAMGCESGINILSKWCTM